MRGKIKRKQLRRPRKGKAKASNYRNPTARTIQIATRRNLKQTLRFVTNQTYVYDSSKTPAGKTALLQFISNSIFNIQTPSSTVANEWKSQDPLTYSNLVSDAKAPNATGWNEWTERYQHFIVTGAKMTYTFEPTSTGVPAILYSHLSGTGGAVTANTTSAQLAAKPYIKRHSLAQSFLYGNNACRGSIGYSARKFEGVTDPDDNEDLKGRFANTNLGTTGLRPTENSHFYLSISPVDPAADSAMCSGVIRVKIEYITHMREPTETNQVQAAGRSIPEMGGGANFGFMSQL